jgi:hypothetical protein
LMLEVSVLGRSIDRDPAGFHHIADHRVSLLLKF